MNRFGNAATLALVLAVWMISGCTKNETLTVVSYGGGAYQQSHVAAFIEPFEKAERVQAESVNWGAEYARLSEMVRTKNVPWDVVEVTAAQFERGQRDKIFQQISPPLDSTVFQSIGGGPPASQFGVPNVYWSTVLAYRKDAFPKNPSSWADFWDTTNFPGSRAMYDNPRGNLEFALLADGVAIADLYPLDIKRAFAKLEALRPHVRVWWSDGTEPVRLLLNKQVDMTPAWSGRIYASDQAREGLGYSWAGAAHELDYWVIPVGSRNADLASRFIRFASSPGVMADQAELTAYGPANALALKEVDPKVLPSLPTAPENWAISFVVDASWWAENEAAATSDWVRWRNK